MSAISIRHGSRYRTRRYSKSISPLFFIGCCLLTIVSISSIDIWFAVENASIIKVEKNPICLTLMKLDPEGFTFFIAGKASGTLVVVLTLLQLHRLRYRHAMLITIGVTLFQIGLLTYLTLSDPTMYNLPNFSLLFCETRESIWELN